MIGILEKFGIGLSALCMIHCIATPITLVFFGGISHAHDSHLLFDVLILTSAAIVMLLSILNSEIRSNSLKVIGLGLSFFGLSFFVPSPFNHLLFVLGSLIWFYVHFRNLRSHNANHLA